MAEVNYRKGNTHIYSDGEKVTIINETSKNHVQQNVDDILGEGEYAKLVKAKYLEEYKNQGKGYSPFSKRYELISSYIPEVIKKELKTIQESGTLVTKYFK